MLAPLLLAAILGTEVPLGTPVLHPATATLRGIATNGRDFLVTWNSIRGTFAERVDASGHPLEPQGHAVDADGALAWDGDSYLLVSKTATRRLDEDGRPLGAPIPLALDAPPLQAASNGRTIVAIEVSGDVVVAGFDGNAIRRQSFGSISGASPPVIVTNGDYAFVVGVAATSSVTPVLVTIDGTSGAITSNAVMLLPAQSVVTAAIANGKVLLAWTQPSGVATGAWYAFADLAGIPRGAPVPITISPAFASPAGLAAVWDGNRFVVAFGWYDGELRQYRIEAAGDSALLASRFTGNVCLARGAGGVLAVWNERNAYAYGDQIAGRLDAAAMTNILALSPATQSWPRIADGGALAAWREETFDGEIDVGMIGGGQATIADAAQTAPAIARGTKSYLVGWAAVDHGITTVYARRVGFDGTPLGNILIVGHGALYAGPVPPPPSIACDGTNFFIVWNGENDDLVGARVSQDGALVDATPIPITNVGPHSGFTLTISVLWDGREYVVGWLDQLYFAVLISPAPPAPANLRFIRVTASGQVLDPNPPIIWNAGAAVSLSLTNGPNGIAAVWLGAPELQSAQTCLWSLQGKISCAPRADAGNVFPNIDLAWSGSEFVATWADFASRSVVAERFDASFKPIDAQPFVVATNAWAPSIAASPTGTTIGYVRRDNDRAFLRPLDRLGVPPKHRAAGR